MKLNKEKIIFLVILLFVVLTVISSKKDFTVIKINFKDRVDMNSIR